MCYKGHSIEMKKSKQRVLVDQVYYNVISCILNQEGKEWSEVEVWGILEGCLLGQLEFFTVYFYSFLYTLKCFFTNKASLPPLSFPTLSPFSI